MRNCDRQIPVILRQFLNDARKNTENAAIPPNTRRLVVSQCTELNRGKIDREESDFRASKCPCDSKQHIGCGSKCWPLLPGNAKRNCSEKVKTIRSEAVVPKSYRKNSRKLITARPVQSEPDEAANCSTYKSASNAECAAKRGATEGAYKNSREQWVNLKKTAPIGQLFFPAFTCCHHAPHNPDEFKAAQNTLMNSLENV